jgi:hypothetical protein
MNLETDTEKLNYLIGTINGIIDISKDAESQEMKHLGKILKKVLREVE